MFTLFFRLNKYAQTLSMASVAVKNKCGNPGVLARSGLDQTLISRVKVKSAKLGQIFTF